MAEATSAFISKGTKLMVYSTDAYEELVKIKSAPALGAAKEKIETTDLSSGSKTYTSGLIDYSDLEFTYNYTKADYGKVNALDDDTVHTFAVYVGAGGGGEDGKFYIQGKVNTWINEQSTDAVVEATIHINPTAEISDTDPHA